MKRRRAIDGLFTFLLVVGLAGVAAASEPAEKHDAAHGAAKDGMKAQHERMAAFKSATETLADGIILGNGKTAEQGAARLLKALESHEKDVPPKNRARIKEFHTLHVEMGQRTQRLLSTITAKQFPGAALAYGRVLEICATCHKLFRD